MRLERKRENLRRLILRELGVSPYEDRVFSDQVEDAPYAAAIMALPEDTSRRYSLVDLSGSSYFIVGRSDPLGSDVF